MDRIKCMTILLFILGTGICTLKAQVPVLGKDFVILDTMVKMEGTIVFEPKLLGDIYFLPDSMEIPDFKRRRKLAKFVKQNGNLIMYQKDFRFMTRSNNLLPMCVDSFQFLSRFVLTADTIELNKGYYLVSDITYSYFLLRMNYTKNFYFFWYKLYRKRGDEVCYILTPTCF